MEVIGFQLVIIFSIAFSFWKFGKKKAFYVSIFWSLWTVALLFFPPLVIIQLGFIWGTYFICKKIDRDKNVITSKQEEIEKLLAVLEEGNYSVSVKARIMDAAKGSRVTPILGNAHRDELQSAINTASESLIVLSGWVRDSVINDQFIISLGKAISRGVKIYIGYGWEGFDGTHPKSHSTQEALQKLELIREKFPQELNIAEFPNHQKILIKDSDYIVCGSCNFLSNNSFKNEEMSMKIYSLELAKSEGNRIKKQILENS